jgi:hypothetical protein
MHCRDFLTHPVAPAVLRPSLREERGGGRLRARGESIKGKTQNLLCLKYFQLTRRYTNQGSKLSKQINCWFFYL